MDDKPIKVLLIEDNPGDVHLIGEMLVEGRGAAFDLEYVDRLSAGLERLSAGDIDVVLLDLWLPDSQGLDTFVRLRGEAPQMPIVVLTGLDDEALGIQAVRKGAQDCLVKRQVNSNLLVHAVRYAIERKQAEEELRRQAALDGVRVKVYEMREPGDMETVLVSLYDALKDVGVEFDDCSVQIVDEEKERVESYFLALGRVLPVMEWSLTDSVGYKAWRQKQPIYRRFR